MTSTKLGDSVDTRVASIAERMVRNMTRRDVIHRGVLGAVGAMGALAIGARPAAAAGCSCGPTYRCGHWGHSCPCCGCPSGMKLCKNGGAYCSCASGHYNSQGYCCEYSSGWWVACGGICCGHACNGYKVCYDCKGHGCSQWCTCLSQTYCCECATPEDVRKEQARAQALAEA